ncbi:MAG: hypothetical protein QOG82_1524 [Actinomycetota bacterium]|nr:hypothetical protein [Actinomycetota bacterium]
MDEVEALYRALLDAWNERDASAFGGLFTLAGTMVGFDGSPVGSRASIVEHLTGIFADHQPAAYVAKVREVRELVPGAALLRAVVGMVPPGESAIKPDVNAIQSLVAVARPEGWRVAHFQTTPAAFHGRPEAAAALTAELQEVLGSQGDG